MQFLFATILNRYLNLSLQMESDWFTASQPEAREDLQETGFSKETSLS